jgi:peptide/nickel transport system permease protein
VWQYIVKRILLMIPTLLGAALVVFVLMNIVPGDIAMLVLGAGEQGGDVNFTELERVRQKLGLDRPLYEQFFSWVWGIVRFDFGTSLWSGAPVLEELRIRFPLTFEVALFATLISTLIAIPLGTLAAIR